MEDRLTKRFTEKDLMVFYKWAGEGYTVREMVKLWNRHVRKSKENKIVMAGTIERILQRPEAYRNIARFQLEFLKSVQEIPLSEKKVRLHDLDNLRQRLMYIINNCHFEHGEKNINRFLNVSRRAIEVLQMARDEMEPKHGISIGIGLGQGEMSDLSDREVQKERDELLEKFQRSIQRTDKTVSRITEGDEAEGLP